MTFDIQIGDMSISMPDTTVEHDFTFIIDHSDVMNSNRVGYAKTMRGQMALNGQRNSQKRNLVKMGHDAAEGIVDEPITKAYVLCEVTNSINGRFDPPNLELTEKHLLDGMVQAGLMVDDNSSVIVGGTHFIEHVPTEEESERVANRKQELIDHEKALRERARKNNRKRKDKRPSAPYIFHIRIFDFEGNK